MNGNFQHWAPLLSRASALSAIIKFTFAKSFNVEHHPVTVERQSIVCSILLFFTFFVSMFLLLLLFMEWLMDYGWMCMCTMMYEVVIMMGLLMDMSMYENICWLQLIMNMILLSMHKYKYGWLFEIMILMCNHVYEIMDKYKYGSFLKSLTIFMLLSLCFSFIALALRLFLYFLSASHFSTSSQVECCMAEEESHWREGLWVITSNKEHVFPISHIWLYFPYSNTLFLVCWHSFCSSLSLHSPISMCWISLVS